MSQRACSIQAIPAIVPLLLLATPATANPSPMIISMVTNVPVGKKPTLTVKATTRVVDVTIELQRTEDDSKITLHYPAMSAGQSKTIPLGDGALGPSHWIGLLSLTAGGESWSSGISMDTMVAEAIRIGYQRDHLFLDRHVLEFQISRPSRELEVELTVLGDQGETIGEGKQTYTNAAAGKWLRIPWEPTSDATVMMMKLKVSDPGGWAEETLTPWSISIPHDEVNFASGSFEITPAERPKLDASYSAIMAEVQKAQNLGVKCSLYISGHTDTVGSRDKNQKLSVDRARAIASYFRKKGLTIKVSYEGFGEDRLKVVTADETDEPRNRRADYVLSAEAPPSLGQTFRWKEVK